ncbi:MAG TPA: universal stress protein [Pseudolabrys sp.]|nr:universal stress protein [Pseudolabrys sp.]
MRSLLLALDDTPASEGATKLALSLAARHDAAVTGATVLDVDYLTPREPGGLGTAYYKFKTDIARLKQGHELAERLSESFLQRCKTRNVKGNVLAMEGRPWDELCAAAVAHDLILIGRDSDLHGESSGGLAKTVAMMLRENPRPLLVAPANAEGLSRIVIAYDGSVPAARTLQIFTLLGLVLNSEIHVISVDPAQDVVDRRVRQASTYLKLYDIACITRAIASGANPAELVVAEARAIGADLLMMGAYGHRGWKETILGSFTTRLLSECPTALFVHH